MQPDKKIFKIKFLIKVKVLNKKEDNSIQLFSLYMLICLIILFTFQLPSWVPPLLFLIPFLLPLANKRVPPQVLPLLGLQVPQGLRHSLPLRPGQAKPGKSLLHMFQGPWTNLCMLLVNGSVTGSSSYGCWSSYGISLPSASLVSTSVSISC